MQLQGKRALVTGGTRSIGRAITLALANDGADVVATYRTTPGECFRTAYGKVDQVSLDVRYPETVMAWEFDILINNAAITAGRSIPRTDEMDWNQVLDVNLSAAWRLMRLCLPHMINVGWGRIVNVSSVVGVDGRLGPATYAASKGGLIALTKAAAHETARKGVTVNAVAPGFIADTGLMSGLSGAVRDMVSASIPMDRLGTTKDVADAVLYLTNAPYVTGEVLNVSGGYLT